MQLTGGCSLLLSWLSMSGAELCLNSRVLLELLLLLLWFPPRMLTLLLWVVVRLSVWVSTADRNFIVDVLSCILRKRLEARIL